MAIAVITDQIIATRTFVMEVPDDNFDPARGLTQELVEANMRDLLDDYASRATLASTRIAKRDIDDVQVMLTAGPTDDGNDTLTDDVITHFTSQASDVTNGGFADSALFLLTKASYSLEEVALNSGTETITL